MTEETGYIYEYKEYGLPWENTDQALTFNASSPSEADQTVIKNILQHIWDKQLGNKVDAVADNAKGYVSVAVDTVFGNGGASESENSKKNLMLGFTAFTSGGVTTKPRVLKGDKKVTQNLTNNFTEAYVFAYCVKQIREQEGDQQAEYKASCKAWKVVPKSFIDMKITNKDVCVAYSSGDSVKYLTLLGWYSEVGRTSLFYLPRKSYLVEGMHDDMIPAGVSGDDHIIKYFNSTSVPSQENDGLYHGYYPVN